MRRRWSWQEYLDIEEPIDRKLMSLLPRGCEVYPYWSNGSTDIMSRINGSLRVNGSDLDPAELKLSGINIEVDDHERVERYPMDAYLSVNEYSDVMIRVKVFYTPNSEELCVQSYIMAEEMADGNKWDTVSQYLKNAIYEMAALQMDNVKDRYDQP